MVRVECSVDGGLDRQGWGEPALDEQLTASVGQIEQAYLVLGANERKILLPVDVSGLTNERDYSI